MKEQTNKKKVSKKKEKPDEFDLIVRLDNIEDAIKKICDHIGLRI